MKSSPVEAVNNQSLATQVVALVLQLISREV